MHKLGKILVLLVLSLWCGGLAGAATFHLTDGSTLQGELISTDDNGAVIKLTDGTYAERTPWGKFSQADLRELAQNPKLKDFVEPFIEVTPEERAKRTEVPNLAPPPRLERPAGHSVIGGIFGSGIGLFLVLIVYAGNIYAAYEVSIFRGKPPGLVCGVAAVAPVIGPVYFLSISPTIEKQDPRWEVASDAITDPGLAAAIAAETPADEVPEAAREEVAATPTAASASKAPAAAPGRSAHQPAAGPAAAAQSPAKTYARGQYTFNKRFFETQMPKLFSVVRSDADKDLVLGIRCARGTFVGKRISRVTATDVQLQVHKGAASEDVVIPYGEIQEVQIRHEPG